MHPEIEKLIDLALADGQITEKERNVILKKAEALGLDIEEVEMTLDGRLHQLDASKPKQKEKVGNIKTCPACGAPVKTMALNCSDCGHEFSNTNANSTSVKFDAELTRIRNEYMENGRKAGKSDLLLNGNFERSVLPGFIKNFPVPNTKEDLFEMLSFMSSKVISSSDTENEEINAYQAKALEIITKLSLMPNIEPHVLNRMKEIEAQMKKVKSKNARNLWLQIIFTFGLVYFIYAFIAKLFGYHFWPF